MRCEYRFYQLPLALHAGAHRSVLTADSATTELNDLNAAGWRVKAVLTSAHMLLLERERSDWDDWKPPLRSIVGGAVGGGGK